MDDVLAVVKRPLWQVPRIFTTETASQPSFRGRQNNEEEWKGGVRDPQENYANPAKHPNSPHQSTPRFIAYTGSR